MTNSDTNAIREYHEATNHSYWSVRSNSYGLDWANQPVPFKIYKSLKSISLPQDDIPTNLSVQQALAGLHRPTGENLIPSFSTLARIMYLSAGITKRKPYPGGELYFRAAACTGALYHIDLYLIVGDIQGLDAGVYHFGPHDFGLVRLRSGDYRGVLTESIIKDDLIKKAPVTVVLADTHWRNAWKYQGRAYRHSFWDSGTVLANMLAAVSAYGLPAKVITSFVDEQVARLIGLAEDKESPIALVQIGHTKTAPIFEPVDTKALDYEIEALSLRELEYDIIYKAHRNSSLRTLKEVTELRSKVTPLIAETTVGPVIPLSSNEAVGDGSLSLERTIARRGSTRSFSKKSISVDQLSSILYHATAGINADCLSPYGSMLNQLYLIVNDVEGMQPGSYRFLQRANALELLAHGYFREKAGFLGLEQHIPADASVNVYMLADLEAIIGTFGSRGYRMAQLEAGIIGGKLYLMAYALKLGASGLTFYDKEVVEFFSPSAKDLTAMFLVALGKSSKPETKSKPLD